jgi:hypothetical protein
MAGEQVAGVETPCAAYHDMEGYWELIQDLRGGTDAMQARASTYLAQEAAETSASYDARVARSFLYGAYDDTIERLTNRPFAKPVTVAGKLPDALATLSRDVSGAGQSLTQFGRSLLDTMIDYGLCHILVDYPQMPEGATKADETASGARSRFLRIPPPELLGWRVDDLGNLSEVRIAETRIEPEGAYGDVTVNYIRVLRTDSWELHKQHSETKEYALQDEGAVRGMDCVPFVTVYANHTGHMMGTPPLWKLAQLNLQHFQKSSDQDNILHIARVPILFGAGWSEQEQNVGIKVGAKNAVLCGNPQATLSYVEHSGQAIGVGQEDIEALERRMEVLGLQPLLTRTGNATATGRVLDETKSESAMQAWVRAVESGLRDAYRLAAQWIKVELPEDFSIDVFSDFALSLKAAEDIAVLQKARLAGDISRKTFLEACKRRDILPETLDVDAEVEAAEAEADILFGAGAGGDE